MVAADEGPPARLKPPQEGSSLSCTDYEGRYDDGHHRRNMSHGSLFLVNLVDEALLESALSLTASGQDRFTAQTAQGFYAGELTVEFLRNSEGCIHALRLNRELLLSALRRQRGLPRLGLKTQFVLYLFAKF